MSLRSLAAPACLLTLLVLSGVPSPAFGQGAPAAAPEWSDPPRVHVGGHGIVAQPVGEFSDYVRVGGGVSGFGRVALDRAGLVSLRADLSFLTYGQERQRVCLVQPCRVEVDLITSNDILLLDAGPELRIPLMGSDGRVGLRAGAGAGLAYFSTRSRVEDNDGETVASDDNYSDTGLGWRAGGGLEVALSRGRTPVALDLGVEYRGNGRREYLTSGDITDLPDGSLEFNVRRSDADFLLWRVGVSVGLRPDRD
ncbi:MAG: hypothetical protein EA352_06195 [Gemmatimonadales bacterium]|nr:MAG: hypothetical protein EA352_06195 [Gemmatimonadales bacterium]